MELIRNLKESELLKNFAICLLGTVILAISSKIKIPFYPVPMTMQTFVVLFFGFSSRLEIRSCYDYFIFN